MKKIEKMSFTIDKTKCTFKLYEYEEQTVRKVKVPIEIEEKTLQMGFKYVDTKIKITKYALHQELEYENEIRDTIVCETETYATILTVLKDILQQQVRYIESLQKI